MAKFKWFDDRVDAEREKVARATWCAAEAILTEANEKVPHQDGTLERSGIVTQDGLSGNPRGVYQQADAGGWPKNNFKFDFNKKPIFYISYNTPYAIKQHEDTSLNHRGQGKAKWLENTAKSMKSKISKWIAEEVKKG